MIIWIRGPRGSGKTTLAKELCSKLPNAVNLDGDMMREVWTDLGFSDDDRYENNMRIARLASSLEKQGFDVVVSTICPYIRDLHQQIDYISHPKFINL